MPSPEIAHDVAAAREELESYGWAATDEGRRRALLKWMEHVTRTLERMSGAG